MMPTNMKDAAGGGRVYQVGALFRDNFRVDGILGAGLHGEVYKVTHAHTGVSFALKVMHLEDRHQAGKVARALSTAKGAYRIQHANVVQIHDLGCEPDGKVWVLMELLEGRSLSSLLAPRRSLGALFALNVAIEVAWGLAAAHEAQIIHRDVKPDNVFLTSGGVIKLLDFSIAKVLPEGVKTTQRKTGMGTPAYMSPAQIAGEAPDVRFDVYSLGFLLWEMIVGQHPFEDALRSTSEMFRRQHSVHPMPLSLAARLPDYVDVMMTRATAKDPAERFASIAAMARALIEVRDQLVADEAAGRIVLERGAGLTLMVRSPYGHAEYQTQQIPEADTPPPHPSRRIVVKAEVAEADPAHTQRLAGVVGPAGTLPLGTYLRAEGRSRPSGAELASEPGVMEPAASPSAQRETPQSLVQSVGPDDDAKPPSARTPPVRGRLATLAPVLGLLVVAVVVVVGVGRSRAPGAPAVLPASPSANLTSTIPPPPPPPSAAPPPTTLAAPAPSVTAEPSSPAPAPSGAAMASATASARPLRAPPSGSAKPGRPVPSAPKFQPLFELKP